MWIAGMRDKVQRLWGGILSPSTQTHSVQASMAGTWWTKEESSTLGSSDWEQDCVD